MTLKLNKENLEEQKEIVCNLSNNIDLEQSIQCTSCLIRNIDKRKSKQNKIKGREDADVSE